MEIKLDKSSLVKKLKANLAHILKPYPIQLAYLYGSATTGNLTPFSDVDIALVTDQEVAPKERLRVMLGVEVELAERCGIRNADVRIINDAPLIFRGRVVCDGILLYASNEAQRVEFETSTRDAYFDYLPARSRLQEAFFANVRERGLHGLIETKLRA